MSNKTCITCKTEKPINRFRKSQGFKDGLSSTCKECQKASTKIWIEKTKLINLEKYKNPPYEEFVCSTCKESKPHTEYNKDITNFRGYEYSCRQCKEKRRLERLEKLKIENPAKFQERQDRIDKYNKSHKADPAKTKLYREKIKKEFPNKLAENCKQWREKNKDRNREYCREWQKKAMRENIQFRVGQRIRSRIRRAIKEGKGVKNSKSEYLIGCSFPELKEKIESQFQDGMSWENYGKWQLDHKIACGLFDLTKEEEQLKCFHYSNLQPLWKKDHEKKTTKDIELIKVKKSAQSNLIEVV